MLDGRDETTLMSAEMRSPCTSAGIPCAPLVLVIHGKRASMRRAQRWHLGCGYRWTPNVASQEVVAIANKKVP